MNAASKPLVLFARILISAIFISAGFSKIMGFDGITAYIASQGLPMPMVIAGFTITLEILGGLAIVLGYKVRVAGLLLGLFSILAAFIFHNFWAFPPEQAYIQNIMFMKNLSMAGGLFLLTVFGAGGYSIDARCEAKK
ncbi:DoxX family protein [Polynucleobacter sp. MWH-UH35A]|uniref:DoxX family protein n=1 Tax=Polynucleobacter sp. MWH-UH35A TaxID=1855619 RepID=UPI001BFD644C|nr:DoxX family protein [Polynucleobacter sp. MWH-UH35A]QWD59665.1 DoxX family protein [Polynucleobacter sp. MWH-UH35A]